MRIGGGYGGDLLHRHTFDGRDVEAGEPDVLGLIIAAIIVAHSRSARVQCTDKEKKTARGGVAVWGRRLLLVAGVGLLAALVNHNVAWWPTSRQTFTTQLDWALQLGTDWVITRPERDNVALLYMLADMAKLSGEPRLWRIVQEFLADPFLSSGYIWRRMLDPTAQVKPPTRQQLNTYQDYQRWFLYAIAPQEVELTAAERVAMFAPDQFVWGSRTTSTLRPDPLQEPGGQRTSRAWPGLSSLRKDCT